MEAISIRRLVQVHPDYWQGLTNDSCTCADAEFRMLWPDKEKVRAISKQGGLAF